MQATWSKRNLILELFIIVLRMDILFSENEVLPSLELSSFSRR